MIILPVTEQVDVLPAIMTTTTATITATTKTLASVFPIKPRLHREGGRGGTAKH